MSLSSAHNTQRAHGKVAPMDVRPTALSLTLCTALSNCSLGYTMYNYIQPFSRLHYVQLYPTALSVTLCTTISNRSLGYTMSNYIQPFSRLHYVQLYPTALSVTLCPTLSNCSRLHYVQLYPTALSVTLCTTLSNCSLGYALCNFIQPLCRYAMSNCIKIPLNNIPLQNTSHCFECPLSPDRVSSNTEPMGR